MNTPNRPVAIVLALLAAAGLGTAAFTRSWLVRGNDLILNFGLRDHRVCDPMIGCAVQTNAALEAQLALGGADDHLSAAFAPAGWITFVACVAAVAGLLAAAALALSRRRLDLPVAPTTISLLAIIAALIAGCVFVATKPGPPGAMRAGLSFAAFGAGIVLGIAGSIFLARVNRPPDPDLTEGAMDPDQF